MRAVGRQFGPVEFRRQSPGLPFVALGVLEFSQAVGAAAEQSGAMLRECD